MRPDNAKSVHLAGLMLLACVLVLLASPAASAKERATFCTQQYDPVCAEVKEHVNCVRAPCPPFIIRRQTYANACFARAAGARVLHEGACESGARRVKEKAGCNDAAPARDPDCRSWTDGCNICRRARPGAPGVCTKMNCARKGPARCLMRFGERF